MTKQEAREKLLAMVEQLGYFPVYDYKLIEYGEGGVITMEYTFRYLLEIAYCVKEVPNIKD